MNRIPVVAFADWNSQIHELRNRIPHPTGKQVLEHVLAKVQKTLAQFPRFILFEVTVRAYCGWHKGFEPTEIRRELSGILDYEIHEMGSYNNIPLKALSFGDTALGALSKRVSKGTGSHFPATCRERGHKRLEEKMVDTALVSDLIYMAASKDDVSWLLVIGEDVDLLPGVYTAEGLLAGTRRQIAYLWSHKDKFLECSDIDKLDVNLEISR